MHLLSSCREGYPANPCLPVCPHPQGGWEATGRDFFSHPYPAIGTVIIVAYACLGVAVLAAAVYSFYFADSTP